MISFKCKTCGGEMSVSRNGDLFCAYCGSRTSFSDSELKEYGEFRLRMLDHLSAIANIDEDARKAENIWQQAERAGFRTRDKESISVSYLVEGEQDGVRIYTARNNAIFIFPKGDGRASRFFDCVDKLAFPAADVRGLRQFFPERNGVFELEDGRTLIAVKKSETVFPLSAFGALPPEHAAWILSRLENLCCVLAYSGVAHRGIGPESVFIDAGKHAAYLLGGWWNSYSKPEGSAEDLEDIRLTAKRVMGVYFKGAQREFREFLSGPPEGSAYDDFALWDRTLEKAFGERKFKKLDLTNLKI